MNWKKEVFKNFKLYGVLDLKQEDPEILQKVEAAYKGGADIIQLRSKVLSDQTLLRLGEKIKSLAHSMQRLFFVNDRVDLAVILQADGIHLGQDDLPLASARKIARASQCDFFYGKSTHALAQAQAALEEKPDYIGVGPVFETPTKPDYEPAGLAYVHEVATQFQVPFVAIGGIDLHNIKQVMEAGAKRVAVVRAIFDAPDVYDNTRKLRECLEKNYASTH